MSKWPLTEEEVIDSGLDKNPVLYLVFFWSSFTINDMFQSDIFLLGENNLFSIIEKQIYSFFYKPGIVFKSSKNFRNMLESLKKEFVKDNYDNSPFSKISALKDLSFLAKTNQSFKINKACLSDDNKTRMVLFEYLKEDISTKDCQIMICRNKKRLYISFDNINVNDEYFVNSLFSSLEDVIFQDKKININVHHGEQNSLDIKKREDHINVNIYSINTLTPNFFCPYTKKTEQDFWI